MLSVIVVLLLGLYGTDASHFRGGSMSWRPIGSNQIELLYRVGFKYDHTEPGFDPCTPDAQRDQTVLDTSGKLICSSCSPDQAQRKLDWICDDYDIDQDFALGHRSMIYDIPDTPYFTISYEHCCWISLQSPINPTGGAKGWKMLTTVNLIPRRDGTINSSPQPALIPLEKFYKGCQYKLRIAVSDPDNDIIRCRYADIRKDECPGDGNMKACGPQTDGLTIQKKDCSLYYDTSDVGEGYHAVNVIIEDYARPYNRKSKALSKVSLLFLLLVEQETEVCLKPIIVDPPSCITVRPGEHFEMIVRAEAGDASKPISKIRTQKPYGMQSSELVNDPESPLRKMITLSWDPTTANIGKHPVCFSALDRNSFTSGMSCTFVYVEENPIEVSPDTSNPAPNGAIEAGHAFEVRFNSQIKRPNSAAYIRLIDPISNDVVFEILARSRTVSFSDGSSLIFIPPRDSLFDDTPTGQTKEFILRLDQGVALPESGLGCGSNAAEWRIDVTDAIPPTQAPICSRGPLELFVPIDDVTDIEECSLTLPDETVHVTSDLKMIPYQLCCPNTCDIETIS
ncbi:uncharacterized protein [Amphiura filiformis]|uniref:uncharacterized protein n=1 Tax=Amphiura filiformis TaxID=82378 RepID=UPI003B216736